MAAGRFDLDLLDFAMANEDHGLVGLLLLEGLDERLPTYDPTGPKFDLDDFTDEQAWNCFRFLPNDLVTLAAELNLPAKVKVSNGCVTSGLTALCMVLRRLAYPNRLCELEPFFGRPLTSLSMFINETIDFIYEQHHHRLDSLAHPWCERDQLEEYCQVIANKGAPLNNIFGFIDGTVRPICRPTKYQKVVYNGHKRIHSLKFQSVVLPNGLIGHMYGPVEGRRHDCALLAKSGIMDELENLPLNRNGINFGIYGDPAYPVRDCLYAPFKGANLTAAQQQFNYRMSRVRESVEWGFGNILTHFAFLDYRKDLKVLMSPVAKYYLVGALLANCHACFYGNQIGDYFNLAAPSIEEYLY